MAGASSLRPGRPAPPGPPACAPARSTGTPRRSWPASRGRPGRISRANARVGGNARVERRRTRGWRSPASARSSRIDARRLRDSEANAAIVRVEVRDQALQRAPRCGSARRSCGRCRRSAARGPAGLHAQQRVDHRGGRALGARDVVVGVVERLGAGLAARRRVRGRSSAAVGLEFSAIASWSSTSLRSCARVCCSEVSTWSSWTGVAVCVTLIVSPSSSLGADGEPGLQVDEEVALEEDARPDLRGRVGVQRQPVAR